MNESYTCIDNEYKSKILLEVIESEKYGKFVVYKFWNQVGNIPYAMEYNRFMSTHKKMEK